MKPLDRDIRALRARIVEAERQLAILERAQRELIETVAVEHEALHDSKSTNIVPNMQVPNLEKYARRGRPLEAKHPFPNALQARGMTVTAWAENHGYDRARVKSWFAVGDGGRRIPRDVAESIEKELGIPATLKTWKNGIA